MPSARTYSHKIARNRLLEKRRQKVLRRVIKQQAHFTERVLVLKQILANIHPRVKSNTRQTVKTAMSKGLTDERVLLQWIKRDMKRDFREYRLFRAKAKEYSIIPGVSFHEIRTALLAIAKKANVVYPEVMVDTYLEERRMHVYLNKGRAFSKREIALGVLEEHRNIIEDTLQRNGVPKSEIPKVHDAILNDIADRIMSYDPFHISLKRYIDVATLASYRYWIKRRK